MSASTRHDDSLLTELAAYREHLAAFVEDHAGEYIVMRGETVLGFYPDFESALDAGYEAYGADSFLAKRVTLYEEPIFLPI